MLNLTVSPTFAILEARVVVKFTEHSFEVLGDYLAGPSHVMPTGGSARFASPLNVWDFVKIVSLVALDENTAQTISPIAAVLADAERLDAHANAALARSRRSV